MNRLTKMALCVSILSTFFFFGFTASQAEQAQNSMPSNIDRSAKYLFYYHNLYVETKGPNGDCKYYDILKAFAEKGYIVISEIRPKDVSPIESSDKAAAEVRKLLAAGVSPQDIAVTGHSKGAVIALRVASLVDNPKVNYVIMAGCGIKGLAKAYPDFSRLKGNFLSLYATSDVIAGSCKADFAQAKQDFSGSEIALENAAGHQLFFKPANIWLDPMFQWLKQSK